MATTPSLKYWWRELKEGYQYQVVADHKRNPQFKFYTLSVFDRIEYDGPEGVCFIFSELLSKRRFHIYARDVGAGVNIRHV